MKYSLLPLLLMGILGNFKSNEIKVSDLAEQTSKLIHVPVTSCHRAY